MKPTESKNESTNSSTTENIPENYNGQKTYIGDIDELIFPDDEPYYISER